MLKKKCRLKLKLPSQKANPGMVGAVLSPHRIDTREFCKKFNDMSSHLESGTFILLKVLLFTDGSYEIQMSNSIPTSQIILKVMGMEKGSSAPGRDYIATITHEQINEVIALKDKDFQGMLKDAKINCVRSTAKSMGIRS